MGSPSREYEQPLPALAPCLCLLMLCTHSEWSIAETLFSLAILMILVATVNMYGT